MDDFSPIATVVPTRSPVQTVPSPRYPQPQTAKIEPIKVQPKKKSYLPFDISELVTEDDEPVDNIASSMTQRCILDPLHNTTFLPRPFLADSNIALYSEPGTDPLVPDMFLSMGVRVADDWWRKENRSYLFWEFGKPPEVVLEIVSNKKGGEASHKLSTYANMGIQYYVLYDPQLLLSDTLLCIYELRNQRYVARRDYRLPDVGLSLTLWSGVYEDKEDSWLRWCDLHGNLIPTALEQTEQERQRADGERQRARDAEVRAEQERQRARQSRLLAEEERQRAEQEKQRAEQEKQRAEQEKQRAEQEKQRAEQANALATAERQRVERLIEQLRALGVEPNLT